VTSGSPSARRSPGRLEDEVVAALAATGGPQTTGEVLDQLGSDLAYTTVMTTLARLYDKGMVSRERVGRAYAYELTSPESRVARSMHGALEDSPDRDLALARFVDDLDPADIPVLRQLLEQISDHSRRPRR
jgi:predicted transcriptional regulator